MFIFITLSFQHLETKQLDYCNNALVVDYNCYTDHILSVFCTNTN